MIFFDLDDTLLDNTGAEHAAAKDFYHLHQAHLRETPGAFVRRWKRVTEAHIHRYLAGELSFQGQRRARLREIFAGTLSLSDAEADAMFDAYRGFYESNWRLFSDVVPCFNALPGLKLGVITNGDAIQQKQKLTALGIADRFETIMISGEVGVTKPDVEIFHRACRHAGVNPAECWHVGDDLEADVRGSRTAQMHAVWLNRKGQKSPPGITMITSLKDLNDTIQSSGGI